MELFIANITSAAYIVIPSCIWLAVFLSLDKHKESTSHLLVTFVGGMASFFAVQSIVEFLNPHFTSLFGETMFYSLLLLFILYILIELTQSQFNSIDEPYDYIVYYVTAILGYSLISQTFTLVAPGSTLISSIANDISNISRIALNLIYAMTATLFGGILAYIHTLKAEHHKNIFHVLAWGGASVLFTVLAYLITGYHNFSTFFVAIITWILFICLFLIVSKVLQLKYRNVRSTKKKALTK